MRKNEYRVRRSDGTTYAVIRRIPQVVRVYSGAFALCIGGILVVMSMSQSKDSFWPFIRYIGLTRTIRVRCRCANLRMTVYIARIRLFVGMFDALAILRIRVSGRVGV